MSQGERKAVTTVHKENTVGVLLFLKIRAQKKWVGPGRPTEVVCQVPGGSLRPSGKFYIQFFLLF